MVSTGRFGTTPVIYATHIIYHWTTTHDCMHHADSCVWPACQNCHDAHDVVTYLIAGQLVANNNPKRQNHENNRIFRSTPRPL
jgi:hypothetical protein